MKGIKYAANKSCLFKFVKRNINIIINKSFPHPTQKENFQLHVGTLLPCNDFSLSLP